MCIHQGSNRTIVPPGVYTHRSLVHAACRTQSKRKSIFLRVLVVLAVNDYFQQKGVKVNCTDCIFGNLCVILPPSTSIRQLDSEECIAHRDSSISCKARPSRLISSMTLIVTVILMAMSKCWSSVGSFHRLGFAMAWTHAASLHFSRASRFRTCCNPQRSTSAALRNDDCGIPRRFQRPRPLEGWFTFGLKVVPGYVNRKPLILKRHQAPFNLMEVRD